MFINPKQVYDAIIELDEKTQKNVAINVCEPNMLLFRQWWYELFELLYITILTTAKKNVWT